MRATRTRGAMVCFENGRVPSSTVQISSVIRQTFAYVYIEPRLRSWQPARDRCYFSSIRSTAALPPERFTFRARTALRLFRADFQVFPAVLYDCGERREKNTEKGEEGKVGEAREDKEAAEIRSRSYR